MKKIWTILLVLAMCGQALWAQQTTPAQPGANNDYLEKSRKQKTAAWLLLGGGAAMVVGGSIWWGQEFTLFGESSGAEEAAVAMVLVGGAAMVGSIPLFIASARNKRKAEGFAFTLKPERVDLVTGTKQVKQYIPALSLRVSLK